MRLSGLKTPIRLFCLDALNVLGQIGDSDLLFLGAVLAHLFQDRTPDRHQRGAVGRRWRSKLQDCGDVRRRELPVIVGAEQGQVDGLGFELRCYRARASTVRAVAWRAIACEHLFAVGALRFIRLNHDMVDGFRRRLAGI